jgi:hypothetical protein
MQMLKKLSLAALVAMGSMSVASANTDLTEAIKGVTIGGYLRYRYTEENEKTNRDSNHENTTTNEYKAVVNLGIKASETVSVHGTLVYKNSFKSNNDGNKQGVQAASPFGVKQAYIEYKADGADVKAGMQWLATPLSDHDDDRGSGVLATYTTAGITGVAAYFNALNLGSDDIITSQDLYVLAAIADIKPVKVQVWYYNVSDSGDNTKDGLDAYFLEAAANVDIVSLKAQYASEKDNSDNAKRQKFFAMAATAKVDNNCLTAAYLNFGKNGANVAVSGANADGLIAAGDSTADMIQQNSTYGDDDSQILLRDGWGGALVASTKIDNIKAGVQYVHATSDIKPGGEKSTFNEYDLDLAYQYNKKLTISGYYAIVKGNIESEVDKDWTLNQARLEVKYKF